MRNGANKLGVWAVVVAGLAVAGASMLSVGTAAAGDADRAQGPAPKGGWASVGGNPATTARYMAGVGAASKAASNPELIRRMGLIEAANARVRLPLVDDLIKWLAGREAAAAIGLSGEMSLRAVVSDSASHQSIGSTAPDPIPVNRTTITITIVVKELTITITIVI